MINHDRTLNGTQRMLDDAQKRRANWSEDRPVEPNPDSRAAKRRAMRRTWRQLRRKGIFRSLGSLVMVEA